jgi:hypothetical protein
MGSRDRTRRYRQRQREGTVCVTTLQIHRGAIEDLVALGWLRVGGTPHEVRQAFLRFMEAALEARIKSPHLLNLGRPRGPVLGETWVRHQIG